MEKRIFMLLSLSIVILLVSMSFASAITGSIGNARAILYPEVGKSGLTIERTILVKNVNTDAINIRLETNSSVIEIADKTFTLEPGSEKNARFKIKLKKAGDYSEKINVFFTPLDGKGAGVALSSTIIIRAAAGDGNEGTPDDSEPGSDSGSDYENYLTGNVISDNNFLVKNKRVLIASGSTLMLALLLVLLLFLSKKKKGKDRSK